MINFLKKYAEAEAPNVSFIEGWEDEYGNIMPIVAINGKKYCFTGEGDSPTNSLNYCFGIGAEKSSVSKKTPAGIGQYLIGKSLEKGYADEVARVVHENRHKFRIIPNKSGASWLPKSKSQAVALQRLVGTYEEINSALASSGVLYPEGDKAIYGTNIKREDIPTDVVAAPTIPAQSTQSNPSVTPAQQADPSAVPAQQVSGDTPNVIAFIPFLKEEFRRVFGRDLNKFSTFRSAIQQAYAMRFPIRDGTYDQLYGRITGAAQIKDLINSERYEEAANIISRTDLAQGSHMAGKAIDVPFGPNGLRSSDFDKFQRMIASASKRSGINASINFEKVSHFHINVK